MSGVQRHAKRGVEHLQECAPEVNSRQLAMDTGVVFEVVGSRGEVFGLCVRTPDDDYAYVEPRTLTGMRVRMPMVVRQKANTPCLVASLRSALKEQLDS